MELVSNYMSSDAFRWEWNSINAGLDLLLLRMTGICALQNIIMEVMTTGCFILDRN